MNPRISVILPAFNEESSIGLVLDDLPQARLHQIIVVNNASTDNTAEVARQHGATVVDEPRRGYGSACLRGIATLDTPDIVVFLDADYSDYPEEIDLLVQPIAAGEQDFVLGSRMLLPESRKALLPQARYGNQLAVFLIRLFFGYRFTDLGPFRAIRYASLKEIGMRDTNFGWTVEMQIKAVKNGLRIQEVDVTHRRRTEGVSKISGSFGMSVRVGAKMFWALARERLR